MSIFTSVKKVLSRNKIRQIEELQKQDLLNKNREQLENVNFRQGLLLNSGLSEAEKQYILSDSIVTSAIMLYQADVSAICDKSSCVISSSIPYSDDTGEIAKKEERVRYIFNEIFSKKLIETIILNLLNNGEIFLNTKYNRGLAQSFVSETSYSHCVQLCFEDGTVAIYIADNTPNPDSNVNNQYNYNFQMTDKCDLIEPIYMVRIFNPSISNSKFCITLEKGNDDNDSLDSKLSAVSGGSDNLFSTTSTSLLKQVYPDWLNGKLLELAVYRDRIARSRFIQLISLELGRTSRQTSDQIYDSVKEYFDKRAVIDLEQQTFKSVVGNEPFIDYKVYTTRNGVGKITFDTSLNAADIDVGSLADLDYNLNKVFAGLGVPKQYLGANDDGSALSNGTSLFFIDEKYQKRVIAYVERIAEGLKNIIKNIILQQEEKDNFASSGFFSNWDFELKFIIPENNQDAIQVKNSKVEYASSLLDLIDKIREKPDLYSIDALAEIVDEDLRKIIVTRDEEDNENNSNGENNNDDLVL